MIVGVVSSCLLKTTDDRSEVGSFHSSVILFLIQLIKLLYFILIYLRLFSQMIKNFPSGEKVKFVRYEKSACSFGPFLRPLTPEIPANVDTCPDNTQILRIQ